MAQGPGKYDDLCTYVREKAQAQGAIVILLDGNDGNGFSVQANPYILLQIPQLLRSVADEIELDVHRT